MGEKHICVTIYLTDSFTWCQERYNMKKNYFFFKQIYLVWHVTYLMHGLDWVNQQAFARLRCVE